MNYSDHHEKVEQFYNVQESLYRKMGGFRLSPNSSKIKKIAYELYGILAMMVIGVYNSSLFISFITLPSILDKIMKAFYMLGTLIGAMVKYICVKRDYSLYRDIATDLHQDIFKPLNAAENDIFVRNLEMSIRVRNLYGYVSCLSLVYAFGLQQVLNPKELPAQLYAPFDMEDSTNFLIMKVFSFISVGYLCFINIAFDSWCTSFMLFIQGQLEILEYRLERIGFNGDSDLEINLELKSCIRLHAAVHDIIGKLEIVIAFPNSLQIFCSMLVLCCNFYAISFTSVSEDTIAFLKFSIYQMAMLSQVFFICYFANEVTLASNKLSHALYSSNWITWNKINRRLVLLTMLRFRDPIRVKSLNRCYHFDLAAFTSIVNTSYSYFALLKQMNN
ncbi:odorant receptor 46a [Eupeodes corollae]|uniref:odorant receptor 46a n=1 Tax=Eupeodes corollae TaxID=290404 RepID=UPI0024922E89|nr:odorant receptor 46a [Eupeodes corollae]